MSQDDWQSLHDPWERVRWARLHWQRSLGQEDSAASAARALGMREGTYRAYERSPDTSKATQLTFEMATRLGQKFKVNRMWLYERKGSPFDHELPPAPEHIAQMLSKPDMQRALTEVLEFFNAPLKDNK